MSTSESDALTGLLTVFVILPISIALITTPFIIISKLKMLILRVELATLELQKLNYENAKARRESGNNDGNTAKPPPIPQ